MKPRPALQAKAQSSYLADPEGRMLTRRSSLPRLSLHLILVAIVTSGIVHISSTLAIL